MRDKTTDEDETLGLENCQTGGWGGSGDCDATTSADPGSSIGAEDSGEDGAGTGAGGGGTGSDSCDWDGYDLCFQFDGYDSTEDWCWDIGAIYGIDTSYEPSACPDGAVYLCDLPSGGDFPAPSTGFFYEPTHDEGSAAAACSSAGGSP